MGRKAKTDHPVTVLLSEEDLRQLDEAVAGTDYTRGAFVRSCIRDVLRKLAGAGVAP